MIRKKTFIIIIVLLIILFSEKIYGFKIKIDEYNLISSNINDLKEENLKIKENDFRSAYQYDDYLDYNIEYSKILYRDLYNLKDEITIYKGKNNGIKLNNLVVNTKGLVGIITKVNENSSIVKLLNNKDTVLSVKVNNVYGILKFKEEKLIIEGINNKAEIKVGDKVTTSDISIYPEDILIGTITEINFDDYEIEQIIKLKPAVDFENIKYIGIITDLRGVK